MEYVVFDLEWNQPFDVSATVVNPVYLSGEIVEIGAVKLNESFEVVDELRLLIKPRFYEKMHRRIATLTGVHDRDLQERGVPFPEACEAFFRWCGEEFTFITWSLSDLPVLIENMQIYGIDVSNLPDLIDAQRIFDREIMRTDTRHSLEHAMEIFNVHGDRAHDALNDSRNTVKVCECIDMEVYLDRYLTRMFVDLEELPVYEDSRELREEPRLNTFMCPWCGSEVSCEDWIPGVHHKLMTYGSCAEGDEFLVLLDEQNIGKGIRAKRTIYDMSDDFWERYCERKEELALSKP